MLQRELSDDSRSILTEELQKFNNSIFEIPNFDSIAYKKNICDVFKKVEEIDNFTDDLERKVDMMLAAQQREFVNAYESHMRKIKEQFKTFEAQVLKQQQLIKYYQNQGKMSNLIKKVAMLEEESKNLYSIIAKKQKEIKSLNLQNKVQIDENKRLTNQLKEMIRFKNKAEVNDSSLSKSKDKKNQFFATQVLQCDRSLKNNLSRTTDEKGKVQISYQMSENSILGKEATEHYHGNALRKKINELQLKNRKLASFNSKVIDSRNQFQNLFIDAVSQIKKQVKLRKKMNYCSYDDFKKQDKLSLLVTVISNQEVLRVVYEKLFSNSSTSLKNLSINPEEKNLNFDSSNSEYLHNYTKYKRKKESQSIQSSQKSQYVPHKNVHMSQKRTSKISRRGRTQDISILPYL